jgi:site-specific recombinase XerD
MKPVRKAPEPTALAHLRDQADDLLAGARAPNTLKAYRTDWRHFSDWCAAHGADALPASADSVALYLTDMAAGYKYSTIRRHLTSIHQAHRAAGFPSPAKDIAVESIMAGIRRRIGAYQEGKSPLVTPDILSMVAQAPDSAAGLRDRALLLIGFAGAFRRSELVALDVRDLAFVPEGVVVLVRQSKTDQDGQGLRKAIPNGNSQATCAVTALRTWLRLAGITSGPVFRAVNRHGNIAEDRLTAKSVALIVKKLALAAGLDPTLYAGHSLRAGLATQAAISGVSETAIIRQGNWKSEKMARRYIRDGALFRDNAAGQIGL